MELAMQQEKAKQLRADIIKMLYLCQSGHPADHCLWWRCSWLSTITLPMWTPRTPSGGS